MNTRTQNDFEWIKDAEGPVALIIRADFKTAQTHFFTQPDMDQQLGVLIHPKGAVNQAHDHRSNQRVLTSSPECLIIRRGSCEMTLFDRKRRLISVYELHEGDVALLLAGGHGFRMLEDCEIIETRAGTFPGDDGKVRF